MESKERSQGKEAVAKELCTAEICVIVADGEGVHKFKADVIAGTTALFSGGGIAATMVKVEPWCVGTGIIIFLPCSAEGLVESVH